ncbi:MAG: histidine phosphatase family protein [Bryobacteraceae bacterium]
MTALLIRHAMTDMQDTLGERAGLPLSAEGQAQARRLAVSLQRENLAAIFTSPIARAVETAAIVAEARGLTPISDASLREIDVGDWNNRTVESLAGEDSWKFFNSFRSGTRCPGGEMTIEAQTRVVVFLERISRQYPDATVAIVSHADVIRAAICHYLGVPLDLSLRLRISHASISTLALHEFGAELIALNVGSGA